jgi:hypothetical protein
MTRVDVTHGYELHTEDVAACMGHSMINIWENFKTISSMTAENYIGLSYDKNTGKML